MMPEINWLAIIVAGLIPCIVGAIYYGPLFGKVWMDSLGFTEDDLKKGNMGLMYGTAILLAMLAALFMKFLITMAHKDVNSAGELYFNSGFNFGHGAFHGFFLCLGIAIPVIVSLSIFQRNSWKNIAINCLYWLICFSLMGGILDAWN